MICTASAAHEHKNDTSDHQACPNDLVQPNSLFQRLCCTNPVRDSSGESSVVAGMHEQTCTPNLKDQELASL